MDSESLLQDLYFLSYAAELIDSMIMETEHWKEPVLIGTEL